MRKQAGKWRAEIEVNGVRRSATRETKAAVAAWAAEQEAEIRAVKRGAFPNKTMADALRLYGEKVSPTKRGARPELLRMAAFERDFPKIASKRIPVSSGPMGTRKTCSRSWRSCPSW